MPTPTRTPAVLWLDRAKPGYCESTDDGKHGNCRLGQKGNWRLTGGYQAQSSWLLAVEECLRLCWACERCNYLTVAKLRDGLWAADCSKRALCRAPSIYSYSCLPLPHPLPRGTRVQAGTTRAPRHDATRPASISLAPSSHSSRRGRRGIS